MAAIGSELGLASAPAMPEATRAEAARKGAAPFALFTGFSMLSGAFIACVAGAIGGRRRDAY